MQYNMTHYSVLSKEVLEGLQIDKNDIVLDGTINGGGHSLQIAELLGERGTLIGIDLDQEALTKAKERLNDVKPTVHLKEDNYRNFDQVLDELSIPCINKMLLDLGFSTNQIESSGRGFSFRREEPLLMTLSANSTGLTAEEIVNEWDEENIADVIYGYGEERFSRKIAKGIVEARPIKTTLELVKVIENSVPNWYKKRKIHPATKTFQALRITVNDEIGSLRTGLSKGVKKLCSGGRIAVITFHSIEDRVVKNIFKDAMHDGIGTLVNKKPIIPTEEEIKENPASRSAKLRIFQKS